MFKSILWIGFFAIFTLNSTSAQTYKLIKEIDAKALGTLIDSLMSPAKTEINFAFSSSDIKYTPYRNKAERLKDLPKYEKKVKENPEDLKSYFTYHSLLLEANPADTAQFRQAKAQIIQKLKNRVTQNEKDGESAFDLAGYLQEMGDFDQVFSLLEKVSVLMPDSAKVWWRLGLIYNTFGEYGKAKELYLKAIQKDDKNMDAHVFYLFSDLYANIVSFDPKKFKPVQIDLSMVEKALQKYKQDKSFMLLYHSGQLLEIFYNFSLQASFSPEAEINIKNAYLKAKSNDARLPKIQSFFENSLKTAKTGKSYLYTALGVVAFAKSDMSEAIQQFQNAIQQNPEKLVNYKNIIFVQLIQDQAKEAELTLKNKMQVIEDGDDYCTLARIYSMMKSLDKRQETISEGLKKYPNHANLLYYQALLSHDARKDEEAYRWLEKAVVNDKNNKDAVFAYGVLSLKMAKINEALDALYFAQSKGDQRAKEVFESYFKKE